MKHPSSIIAAALLLATSLVCIAQRQRDGSQKKLDPAPADQVNHGRLPNILFIIMDDVGIDQMKVFGYGGATAPATPNIDAVANGGVRFRNTWSMPECSPSRAIFFEGRYPLRTNIYSAILDDDLANSQMSPFEASTPKLLRAKGYDSAMFGKFHLAGPNYNPFGDATPYALGWNHFDGFLEGAPHPIDTTAGGAGAPGTYSCGFVPNASYPYGADVGACYMVNKSCTVLSKTAAQNTPGKTCLDNGGIFIPNQACQSPAPANLNFNQANGYYVWNHVIINNRGQVTAIPLTDPRSRGYVSVSTTDATIAWIKAENAKGKRWMATVSFANAHTPYQQPPNDLLPAGSEVTTGYSCTGNDPGNEAATRVLSNQMIEAMDTEIGQVLVGTGVASANRDGSLNYNPSASNTMVVIVGDNGTFAPGVKAPFDFNRAKGYVYQTGVWVPLIVSGPLVNSPNREVDSMVNIADLFQLFGEMAGINVHKAVPKSHILDSAPLLPYLTNPNQDEIRKTNFTQTGNNIHVGNRQPPPCVIPLTTPPTCVQIFADKGVCEYEGGDWYGPNPTKGTQQYSSCCEVQSSGIYQSTGLNILPDFQTAVRNDDFKLVQMTEPNCSNPGKDTVVNEFYSINEAKPLPEIDKVNDNLCDPVTGCPSGLSADELNNYNQLLATMQTELTSQPACPGDGNEDMVVNLEDVLEWGLFLRPNPANPGYSSSWFDFNYDGYTNVKDLQTILANYGTRCLKKK